jgi:hypothetical protein
MERNDGSLVVLEQDEVETIGEGELGDALLELRQVLGPQEALEEEGQTQEQNSPPAQEQNSPVSRGVHGVVLKPL